MGQKTNALRILDAAKIKYQTYEYTVSDQKIDGISVAQKIGQDVKNVYKTLVTIGADRALFVFVLPVAEELDLKKAAKAVNEKSIQLLPLADITKMTGYVRGGCSPVGMKKQYPTIIDQSAASMPLVIVSAGKIGLQMQLNPHDLCALTAGRFADIVVLTRSIPVTPRRVDCLVILSEDAFLWQTVAWATGQTAAKAHGQAIVTMLFLAAAAARVGLARAPWL